MGSEFWRYSHKGVLCAFSPDVLLKEKRQGILFPGAFLRIEQHRVSHLYAEDASERNPGGLCRVLFLREK
jgi:hypothetical protein